MSSDNPLSNSIMPNVAMNGGILALATNVPETAPHNAPFASAAIRPVQSGRPQKVSTTPAITAQKVISVPTDRSMPAVMITKVHAIRRRRGAPNLVQVLHPPAHPSLLARQAFQTTRRNV